MGEVPSEAVVQTVSAVDEERTRDCVCVRVREKTIHSELTQSITVLLCKRRT